MVGWLNLQYPESENAFGFYVANFQMQTRRYMQMNQFWWDFQKSEFLELINLIEFRPMQSENTHYLVIVTNGLIVIIKNNSYKIVLNLI